MLHALKIIAISTNIQARCSNISTSPVIVATKIIYDTHGDPNKVLKLATDDISVDNIQGTQVLVKVLTAPINPSDINQIEGRYFIQPPLPCVPGNEFIGEIIAIGSDVIKFNVGDKVIPNALTLGTWRSHFVTTCEKLYKVPPNLSNIFGATLIVNTCSAYRMLEDFVKLSRGDCLIQNGANSGVGQIVIQLAKLRGIHTINIIRERPDIESVKNRLEALGASIVLSDKQMRIPSERNRVVEKVGKAKLGLNCVSGKSIDNLSLYVENHSTVVTYGGMSKEPTMISTGKFIFNDLRCFGFWNSRWVEKHRGQQIYKDMLENLINMSLNSKLLPPQTEPYELERFGEAIQRYCTPYLGVKQLFTP